MKICRKCGCLYTDDNMFCEQCGLKLEPQMPDQNMQNNYKVPNQNIQNNYRAPENKKINPLFFLIPVAAVLIVLAVLFLFRDKLPFLRKETDAQETVQQEEKDSKEEQESSAEKGSEEDTKKEGEQGNLEKEGSEEAKSEEQISEEVSYADSEINGVDNAYVQIVGTIAEEKGIFILQLEKASSVCAYDGEDKIVQKKNVEKLALDGTDMEEYLGDKVEIKGKLSADIAEDFLLQVVNMDVKQEAQEETDFTGHRYQLIQADVTWQEAFEDCISRGGSLARINSEEEFRSVIALIEDENMQNVHFYLGGRRDADGRAYYWVDGDNNFMGEMLNPEGDSWAAGHWMENEPSFTSEGDTELYMNLIYYQENWVFNDVPLDITVYYPGKTGYICEFEE